MQSSVKFRLYYWTRSLRRNASAYFESIHERVNRFALHFCLVTAMRIFEQERHTWVGELQYSSDRAKKTAGTWVSRLLSFLSRIRSILKTASNFLVLCTISRFTHQLQVRLATVYLHFHAIPRNLQTHLWWSYEMSMRWSYSLINCVTYGRELVTGGSVRISILEGNIVNMWIIDDQLSENSPPGAVGGWYGSGCFHFSSKSSVSLNNACEPQYQSIPFLTLSIE